MNALWQIILRILWRLRPVQALEVNLHDVIQLGFSLFTCDEDMDRLAQDHARRARLAAAFFDGHRKLDLLIHLRACEIAGVTPRQPKFIPDYSWTHSSTDLMALWRAFQRLVDRFDAYERLARVCATRLKRNPPTPSYGGPLRLDATRRSTFPTLRVVEANHRRLASTTSQKWGRWIARSCAQDGGGAPAFARGPPLISLDCHYRLPTASVAPRLRTPPHARCACHTP